MSRTAPHLAVADTRPDTTLLTGATGFVGGELLLRLMASPRRPIVCLVRADDHADARRRGEATLRSRLGREPTESERARVEWIRADLEEPGLGLLAERRAAIAERVVEVFHCAASLEFDLSLEEAQRINVDAVRHLVELAAEAGPRFRRFHHVSTAFVAGRTRRRVAAGFLPHDRARNFRNTYERTKARAERYLREQPLVPVTIYRPSIIAGRTRSGRTDNWNFVYVPMRQIAQGRLPFLRCGGKALVDTVGIDFVVDGIVALAKRDAPHGATYHLTASERAFDVRQYVDACTAGMRRHGRRGTTQAVSPTSWWLRTRGVALLAHAPSRFGRLRAVVKGVQRGLRTFRPYEPYTAVAVEFDARDEHRFLATRGIEMPPADTYLHTIVEFALRNDFGHSAPEISAPASAIRTTARTRVAALSPAAEKVLAM